MPEKELVERAMSSHGDLLTNIKGFYQPGARHEREVRLHKYRRQLGDADLLVLPALGVADVTNVQVKRFGVKIKPNGEAILKTRTWSEDFSKLVQQSAAAFEAGFSQVYAFAFVCIDARAPSCGRDPYPGLYPTVESILGTCMGRPSLPPGVGFLRFSWSQSLDVEPLAFTAFGGHLGTLAAVREQPAELTAWLTRRFPKQTRRG